MKQSTGLAHLKNCGELTLGRGNVFPLYSHLYFPCFVY